MVHEQRDVALAHAERLRRVFLHGEAAPRRVADAAHLDDDGPLVVRVRLGSFGGRRLVVVVVIIIVVVVARFRRRRRGGGNGRRGGRGRRRGARQHGARLVQRRDGLAELRAHEHLPLRREFLDLGRQSLAHVLDAIRDGEHVVGARLDERDAVAEALDAARTPAAVAEDVHGPILGLGAFGCKTETGAPRAPWRPMAALRRLYSKVATPCRPVGRSNGVGQGASTNRLRER